MTVCSQISFDSRLSDRKYPLSSDMSLTSFQKSWSLSRAGSVSAAAWTRGAENVNAPTPTRTAKSAVNNRRRICIPPILIQNSEFRISLTALLATDRVPQGLHRFRRAGEQVFRELSGVGHDVLIDRVALIEVQAAAGQVLEAQVAIAVDHRVFQVAAHVGRLACEVGEQLDRRVDPHLAQRAGDTGVLRALEARLDLVDVVLHRRLRPHEHQVVAATVLRVRQDE